MMQPHPSPMAPHASPNAAPAVLERFRGTLGLHFGHDRGTTRLQEARQAGGAKARFPRHPAGTPPQAVLINTAGGLTGGDRLDVAVSLDSGANAVVTTQAAERIYRRLSGRARIDVNLTVAAGASLDWLPQETIVFDDSALARTLSAHVHASGRLLIAEAIILGRAAMGERARNVMISDAWRIRRNGTPVFADGLKLAGDATAIMAGGATGNGAAALATLVLVAPDAEARLEAAREVLADCRSECSASAWNGMLVARLLHGAGQQLRADLIRLIECLRGTPMPRVWTC
jgi:urease accessory protein